MLTRSSLALANYLHATLARSSLALANYLYATLTRSSLALANMEKIKKGSYLVSDGAKGIPPLSKTYQLKHKEVNHAGGETVCLKRRGPKPAVSVHTGGIDCTWKKIKDKLPPGIHNRKKGKINKDQQSTAGTA